MNMAKIQKVAAYMRVSTTDQSIDLQREAIRQYAERRDGWQIIEYVDHGVSGRKDSRPAFDQMMKDVRKGCIDRVVVYKVDRLGRSLIHLVHTLQEFDDKK